jgi:hypothetical protein
MKVSQLIDVLKKYDPSAEIVAALKVSPAIQPKTYPRTLKYFHFVVNEHKGQLGAKGNSTILALEMTDEGIGYFKPFIKMTS